MTAAGLPFLSSLETFAPVPRHISVQLWSVREDMAKDAKGTIAALAKMGYREVEPFGFEAKQVHGMSHSDFSKLLKDNGMSMPSTHSGMSLANYVESANDIDDDFKRRLDAAPAMGLKYVICPYMADPERKEIGKMVKLFNAAGRYAQKAGVRFAYHNHDFEYTQKGPDGRLLIEWILHETDPKLVAQQMDIYWVAKANHNPLDWIRIYPGRWKLCHAKDVAKTEKRESVEVGDGSVDFKGIFKQSAKAGLEHFVVELEDYATTPLQGVERSRKGLLKMF